MSLEVARVPQFAQQLSEPLHEEEILVTRGPLDVAVVLLAQEVVAQWSNVGECLRSGQTAAYMFAQFGRKINKCVIYGVILR